MKKKNLLIIQIHIIKNMRIFILEEKQMKSNNKMNQMKLNNKIKKIMTELIKAFKIN